MRSVYSSGTEVRGEDMALEVKIVMSWEGENAPKNNFLCRPNYKPLLLKPLLKALVKASLN